MPPRDPQAVMEKLGQTTLKVDNFFLRRTGFVANQTILKLGEYNLHCVPATLGAEEARFLAVLTASELGLFSKYKTGTHILLLTFDNLIGVPLVSVQQRSSAPPCRFVELLIAYHFSSVLRSGLRKSNRRGLVCLLSARGS